MDTNSKFRAAAIIEAAKVGFEYKESAEETLALGLLEFEKNDLALLRQSATFTDKVALIRAYGDQRALEASAPSGLQFTFDVSKAGLAKDFAGTQTAYLDGKPALFISLTHPRFAEIQASLAAHKAQPVADVRGMVEAEQILKDLEIVHGQVLGAQRSLNSGIPSKAQERVAAALAKARLGIDRGRAALASARHAMGAEGKAKVTEAINRAYVDELAENERLREALGAAEKGLSFAAQELGASNCERAKASVSSTLVTIRKVLAANDNQPGESAVA